MLLLIKTNLKRFNKLKAPPRLIKKKNVKKVFTRITNRQNILCVKANDQKWINLTKPFLRLPDKGDLSNKSKFPRIVLIQNAKLSKLKKFIRYRIHEK